MGVELPAISFICFIFLVVFIPVRRVRCSVVNLAIVSWLSGCNLVHGINALIWAGNVDIRVPVWCDIVTKFLLATIVAISGAFLCMSYHLELLSSARPISVDPKSQRNRLLINFVCCYVIPIIYMFIHFIVQDHRFDLVKDLGCSASIHPSSSALVLMWLPPIIICSISFYFSGRAMHNFSSMSYERFSSHIESRSPMTSSHFLRRIATSFIIAISLCLVCTFSVLSISSFEPWTSWSTVHAESTVINVVVSPNDINSIQITWWGIPTVSIIYIFLSFLIGEESRDALRWFRKLVYRLEKPRFGVQVMLPTHAREAPEMFSRSQSLGTPRSRPQTLELRSGWDDMLDARRSKWWSPGKKSQTSAIASGSPSPSPTSDETFIAATMDYLFSPTAKTLGLPGSGPSNHPSSSSKAAYEIPPRPTTPPLTLGSYIQHAVPSQTAPEDAKSMISSVFDASWPQPPPSPATIASSYNISPSPTLSPVSSNLNFGHPLYPATTSRGQSSPFQESYISSPNIPTLPPASARRTVPKRPSVRSLRRTLSSEKYGLSGSVPGDVIYMTVVKETS